MSVQKNNEAYTESQLAELESHIEFLEDQVYILKGLYEGWDLLHDENKENFMERLKEKEKIEKRVCKDPYQAL